MKPRPSFLEVQGEPRPVRLSELIDDYHARRRSPLLYLFGAALLFGGVVEFVEWVKGWGL